MEEHPPPPTNPALCWAKILTSAPPPDTQRNLRPIDLVFVDNCKSTKGIAVAVVDANAIIQGGLNLSKLAEKFVTVSEVLGEIRDPVSRHFLELLPFSIESMDPSLESVNKVINFAKATGDLQTLSAVDIKLIALTYTLEAEIHGTKNIRDAPPPVQVVKVKRLPEKDLPGWGSNVPNLKEWEALDCAVEENSKRESRILPLQNILNLIPDGQSVKHSVEVTNEIAVGDQLEQEHDLKKPGNHQPKKKEIDIGGEKMVVDGFDASKGQLDDGGGDWRPVVSRSTNRRYLRRKSRREYYAALAEKDLEQDLEKDDRNFHEEHDQEGVGDGDMISDESEIEIEIEMIENEDNGENLNSILEQRRPDEDHELENLFERPANCLTFLEATTTNSKEDLVKMVSEEMDHLEISSQTNESIDALQADDISSQQSLMLRPLSESSVACVTGDFAMQNVLLQMGLRLLAPGGKQIRELHRWILKCHACYTVTADIGRIFCPKCGNGGTLRKVAVTVGENGMVLADRKPRVFLRGTKFSLPLPVGGRDAMSKNLILREDQLPHRFLYPSKKAANKQKDDFLGSGTIFTHHTDNKASHRPQMRQALAAFSGRRNPNVNHYSKSKRK